jgi:hypothetical protein
MPVRPRLLPVALVAFAASAGAAEDLGAATRACRTESDAAARLACYDRAVDRAQPPARPSAPPKAVAPAAATAAAAAATAAPAAATPPVMQASVPTGAAPGVSPSAEENFGRERKIKAEEQEKQQQDARALGELHATVTKIETRMDGLMTLTLDNGQVWRQSRPDSKFRLSEGDAVRIQPGSLNSFILSGPSKRSTRVQRVN